MAALDFGSGVWAATIPTIGCSSTGYLFNTAYSGSPSGPPKPSGSRDTYWQVNASARDSAWPYTVNSSQWVDAYVVSQRAGWASSPFNNADWIAHNTDGTSPSTYRRYTYWYRYQFNLDSALDPSAFYMKLSFYADDSLGDVWVNNVSQSSPNIKDNIDGNNYSQGNGATLVLDNSWKVGQNEILVRIADRGGWSGFLVQYDTQSSTICATRTTINAVSTAGTSTFGYTGTNGIASQSVSTVAPGTSASGAIQTLTAVNDTTTITQTTTPPGYRLNAIACTGQDPGATMAYNTGSAASGGVPARSAQFSFAGNGRALSCTFTNQAVGDGGAYWDGNGTANNNSVTGGAGTWNTSNTNWTDANGAQNGAWAANGVAVFAGTGGAVNTTEPQTIGGLSFRGNGYSLSGSALTGGLTTNTLSADAGVSATVGNPLAGTNAIQKTGAGTITLSGNNSFGGTSTVSAGTLTYGAVGAVPANSAVSVALGATLNLNSLAVSRTANTAISGTLALGTAGSFALSGTTNNSIAAITGSGTITVNSGATLTLTAPISNANVNIVMAGGTLKLSGNAHSFGTLTQTASSSIDFTGGGSLMVAKLGSLGSNQTLTATGWSTTNGHFIVSGYVSTAPARFTSGVSPLNQVSLGGASSALTYWGSSSSNEVLPMLAGTYTYWDATPGNGVVNGGLGNWDNSTLNWTTSSGTPNGTWAGGSSVATFGVMGGAVNVASGQSMGGLIFNADGYVLSGSYLAGVGGSNHLTVTNANHTATIGNVLAGSNGFTKDGAGTLVVTGTNTFTGGLVVSSGTLVGTGQISALAGNVTVSNGATLAFSDPTVLNLGYSGTWNVAGTLAYTASSGNLMRQSGTLIFSGATINVSGGSALSTSPIQARLVLSGTTTGTGQVNLKNFGDASFESYFNTKLAVSVDASSRLQIYEGAIAIGSLSGAGIVAASAGSTTTSLSVGNDDNSSTFSGTMSNTAAYGPTQSWGLIKAGTGTFTVTGNSNTNTGATSVNRGTLMVNGSIASSAVSVASSATLGGSGSVAGTVNVSGTLSPGSVATAGTPGTLNTGALSFNSGGVLAMDLQTSGTTGGTNDLLMVNGNLDLTNATLTINAMTGFDTKGTYTLITYTGTRTGNFSATNLAAISYLGVVQYDDTNRKVNLVAIPRVRITEVSNGGTGAFAFALSGLSNTNLSLSTGTAGVGVTSATLSGTIGTQATIAQTSPNNWPSVPTSVSCIDANGASNGNGTGNLGTLQGSTVTLDNNAMRAGADITCTFTNGNNSISGMVFNDGGAPSGGTNTGTPNDGIRNGSEAGLIGVTVSLTNCAATSYATSTTDGSGAYSLSIPAAQAGQTVCVVAAVPTGYQATGANAAGTAIPSGTPTNVSGTNYSYTRSSQLVSFTAPASGALVLNFGEVPVSTLIATTSTKQVVAGSSAVHGHRFTAGTGGSLQISAIQVAATPPWTLSVFLDPGCTGTVQSGASAIALPDSTPIVVTQGQQVCFVVQDFAPAAATNGTSHSVSVLAELRQTFAVPSLMSSFTATDVSNVLPATVTLSKLVRNVTQGGSFATTNQAKSGDMLEYQITYSNLSSQPVANLEIADSVSQYATFVSADVGTTPAGLIACSKNTPANPLPAAGVSCSTVQAAGGTGVLSWKFTGTLSSGSSGNVVFTVTVN